MWPTWPDYHCNLSKICAHYSLMSIDFRHQTLRQMTKHYFETVRKYYNTSLMEVHKWGMVPSTLWLKDNPWQHELYTIANRTFLCGLHDRHDLQIVPRF